MRNPVDAIVEALAPRLAVKRERARAQLERYRAYDAAAKTRRLAGWKATNLSHSAETEFALDLLRARSRELVRNNEWAKTAVGVWARNAIGDGFKLRLEGPKRASKRALELWKAWAGTTQVDPAGRLTLAGQGSLGMREVVEAGEFLIRRRWRRGDTGRGLAVPLQLELLEPDHLDTTKRLEGTDAEKARIYQGVQYSSRGRLQGYWLYPEHPGDSRALRRTTSVFVPARDVIHVFRQDRIGQVRGVPWGASCLVRVRKIGDYEDAELERKAIASLFVGFVHDIEGGLGDNVVKAAGADLAMEPGAWEELPPGKEITFSDPPVVEGYADYMTVSLHAVAKGFEVTYEDLTGDLSRVNFSSARLGRIAHADAVHEFQTHTWVPLVCSRVWEWFLEAATVAGRLPQSAGELVAEWTPPRPRLADPKTEVTTANLRVRNGFQSLSGAIRELGGDPQEVLEELSGDMTRLDDLGLVLDSDGRQATASGADREDTLETADDPQAAQGGGPGPAADLEARAAALARNGHGA